MRIRASITIIFVWTIIPCTCHYNMYQWNSGSASNSSRCGYYVWFLLEQHIYIMGYILAFHSFGGPMSCLFFLLSVVVFMSIAHGTNLLVNKNDRITYTQLDQFSVWLVEKQGKKKNNNKWSTNIMTINVFYSPYIGRKIVQQREKKECVVGFCSVNIDAALSVLCHFFSSVRLSFFQSMWLLVGRDSVAIMHLTSLSMLFWRDAVCVCHCFRIKRAKTFFFLQPLLYATKYELFV